MKILLAPQCPRGTKGSVPSNLTHDLQHHPLPRLSGTCYTRSAKAVADSNAFWERPPQHIISRGTFRSGRKQCAASISARVARFAGC